MMERSSKFMSLSGRAGIMAGIYALAAAYIAYKILGFNPDEGASGTLNPGNLPDNLLEVISLAIIVLLLAIGTAIILSYKKANTRQEPLWNPTAKRLLLNMAVPLVTGGLLILIAISKGMIPFIIPFTLIFYGLALYGAGKFTYGEIRSLGLFQIALGLISALYTEYGLLFWALGFGILHIIYGIYMHYKYER